MKTITRELYKNKIPHSWDQVTFDQYLKITQANDDYIKLLSVFLEIEPETLKTAKVENFDSLIASLSFLRKEPIFYDTPLTLNGKTLPKDIKWETAAQFEDMRQIIQGMDDKKPLEQLEKFAQIVSIYYQPVIDGEYDSNKTKEVLRDIYQMSCVEVISMGRFFFFKLVSSLTGTPINSLRPPTQTKKKMQATLAWLKLSAFMERFKRLLMGIFSNKSKS